METVAVILIIVLAVAYIVRHFYRKIVRSNGGTCGCSSPACDSAGTTCAGSKESLSCSKE